MALPTLVKRVSKKRVSLETVILAFPSKGVESFLQEKNTEIQAIKARTTTPGVNIKDLVSKALMRNKDNDNVPAASIKVI